MRSIAADPRRIYCIDVEFIEDESSASLHAHVHGSTEPSGDEIRNNSNFSAPGDLYFIPGDPPGRDPGSRHVIHRIKNQIHRSAELNLAIAFYRGKRLTPEKAIANSVSFLELAIEFQKRRSEHARAARALKTRRFRKLHGAFSTNFSRCFTLRCFGPRRWFQTHKPQIPPLCGQNYPIFPACTTKSPKPEISNCFSQT